VGNRIEGNWAMSGTSNFESRGGGIYYYLGGGSRFENNSIRFNVASSTKAGSGGGIAAELASTLVITGNTIEGNTGCSNVAGAGRGGGVEIRRSASPVRVEANHLLSNTASLGAVGEGGAVFVRGDSAFTLTNNIIAGNQASSAGGGLAFAGWVTAPVTGTLLHNTFVDNATGSGDGRIAVHLNSGAVRLTLMNNLISGHSYGLYVVVGSTATLNSTLFFGQGTAPTGGAGNVVNAAAITGLDPLLDGSWHLRAGSPAIDHGVDAGVTTDIDGNARSKGAGYDIGADEYVDLRQLFLPLTLRASP
jgi:hypothetical protein